MQVRTITGAGLALAITINTWSLLHAYARACALVLQGHGGNVWHGGRFFNSPPRRAAGAGTAADSDAARQDLVLDAPMCVQQTEELLPHALAAEVAAAAAWLHICSQNSVLHACAEPAWQLWAQPAGRRACSTCLLGSRHPVAAPCRTIHTPKLVLWALMEAVVCWMARNMSKILKGSVQRAGCTMVTLTCDPNTRTQVLTALLVRAAACCCNGGGGGGRTCRGAGGA